MNPILRLVLGVSAALLFSSCYYDPYYSGSYGSSYGSYGSSYYGYGYAPSTWIIRTSSSRWGYDPYRRCYYDYHHRHYYNPRTYTYYRTPPTRYRTPVYPQGYRHGGHGRIAPPRYDERRARGLPPRPDPRARDGRRDTRRTSPTGYRGSSDSGYRGLGNTDPYRGKPTGVNTDYRRSAPQAAPTYRRGSETSRPGSFSRSPQDLNRNRYSDSRGASRTTTTSARTSAPPPTRSFQPAPQPVATSTPAAADKPTIVRGPGGRKTIQR